MYQDKILGTQELGLIESARKSGENPDSIREIEYRLDPLEWENRI
jgi:hypothetical protein